MRLWVLVGMLMGALILAALSCGGPETENPAGLDTPVDAPQSEVCSDLGPLLARVDDLETRVDALCARSPGVCPEP